jgi:hypothetical protein
MDETGHNSNQRVETMEMGQESDVERMTLQARRTLRYYLTVLVFAIFALANAVGYIILTIRGAMQRYDKTFAYAHKKHSSTSSLGI